MKVADKDDVIHSMLAEEYRRCREVLQALRTKAENLPKGALNVRRKQIKGNEYVYHITSSGGRGKKSSTSMSQKKICRNFRNRSRSAINTGRRSSSTRNARSIWKGY